MSEGAQRQFNMERRQVYTMVGVAALFLLGHSLRIYLYFEEALLFRNNSQKNITSLCDGYNEQSGMDALNPCLDYPFYVLVRFAF